MIIDLSGGYYLDDYLIGFFESLGAGVPVLGTNHRFIRSDALIGKLVTSDVLIGQLLIKDHLILRNIKTEVLI